MTSHDLTIRPLTDETWDLFAALNERNGGLFGGCWCTWFHPRDGEDADLREELGNRELKRLLVRRGQAHAALVCRSTPDGEEAMAWATYGPPEELPGIHHRKQYEAERQAAGEDLPDYRVTCIVVDKRVRRRGLGGVALRGAVALIGSAGGGVVEGYPHDVPPGKKVSSSFLYNTTRTTYEAAGFELVRRKGQGNVIMRRVVAATVD